MFTASLTTEIANATTPEVEKISGNKVWALKHRLLDAAIIAKHGGTIRQIEEDDFTSGIKRLIKMLRQGEIPGFLVDSQTYFVFNSMINHDENLVKELQLSTLIRTENFYVGEKLSFGALIKNESHFEYFENYFTDNLLVLESCYYFRMNAQLSQMPNDDYIFDPPNGGLFYKCLYYSLGAIGLIAIFGALYEFRRQHYLKKTRSLVKADEENEKY